MIAQNLQKIYDEISADVTLVAVSKTRPVGDVLKAYEAGQRIFGENKVQEMAAKYEELPKDIEWHMIGHLQRNKVKYMAHFVNMIHGVDSLKTLKEIDKQASKHNRKINCLLQVKIAKEDTKFGLTFQETERILNSVELKKMTNLKVIGFMGMATFTENESQLQEEFASLKMFFDLYKNQHELQVLSMGMSGDYPLAIKQGSNMIRVGSSIFGSRNYNI